MLPVPEVAGLLLIHGLDDDAAVAAMSVALGSPWDVSAAGHLPGAGVEAARTVIRVEGFASSVAERLKKLAAHLQGREIEAIETQVQGDPEIWSDLRDARPVAGGPGDVGGSRCAHPTGRRWWRRCGPCPMCWIGAAGWSGCWCRRGRICGVQWARSLGTRPLCGAVKRPRPRWARSRRSQRGLRGCRWVAAQVRPAGDPEPRSNEDNRGCADRLREIGAPCGPPAHPRPPLRSRAADREVFDGDASVDVKEKRPGRCPGLRLMGAD